MHWEDLRRQFACTRRHVYLNTGTLGPVPDPLMRRYLEYLTDWNREGPGTPTVYRRWRDRAEDTREALARAVGAHAADLTLCDNVTDALNIALWGLRLPRESRIITSDQEHGALVAPLALLAARGATVDVIPYGQGGEAFLARLGQALERPADLVALSHLSCETGAFVDAGALADLCHERGALLLLDGAQTPGQIPLALNEWAVDLYAFNGHKWMLAPVGSAALYIRPDLRDRVAMTFTGDGPGYRSGYPDRVDVLRPDDGRRFEYGTRNWAAWAAWTDVLTFWAELPADAAYRRQRELASTLRRRLHNLEGVTVWSPELPVGGIVTFSVAGLNAEGLYDALYARDIIGRPVNKGPISGVRLCTAFFNNLDDVARAVEAVAAIVGAAATSRS